MNWSAIPVVEIDINPVAIRTGRVPVEIARNYLKRQ
jgi:hypothetical protein